VNLQSNGSTETCVSIQAEISLQRFDNDGWAMWKPSTLNFNFNDVDLRAPKS